ncbi:MAG: mechanosensitive ion channel [Planctomycetes bacterium]|nr:mechanosensitive ion channel [Planctomycetota bacterium]
MTVFVGFYFGGWLIQRGIDRIGRGRGLDEELVRFLGKAARVTMVVVGSVCALGTFGVDVTALVAGLGLTGFALGFALKDIISNLLAGILVLIYRPFGRGDRIKVAAFEGVVQSIDLRYTILSDDDRRYFVPNSMLFTNPITVVEPRQPAEAEAGAPTPAQPPKD